MCANGKKDGGIVFPFKSSPATMKTGEDLSVICTLSNDISQDINAADVVYSWYDKNENKITNENSNAGAYLREFNGAGGYERGLTLNIDGVDDDDSGVYKCTAEINDNTYEGNFILEVKASLGFKNCEDSQFGVLGKQSKVLCTADAEGIPVETTWERNGIPISIKDGRYQFDETAMIIMNTTNEDAGEYKFKAKTLTEDSQSKSVKITFKVYIAPTIISPILQTTAIVGRKAQLFCKAIGQPAPEIEWRKEGSTNVLTTTDRFNVTTKTTGNEVQGILEFMSVQKDDEAFYSCTAKNVATDENKADEAVTKNKLIVQTPPKIVDTIDASGTEGGAASLVCQAFGDPPPVIVWYQEKTGQRFALGYSEDGVTVTQEDISTPESPGTKLSLQFNSLTHDHAGDYKCEAKNSADMSEKTVKLEVRYSPNFDAQDETKFYTWIEAENFYIPCVATANPEPLFEWFKNDKPITAGDSFYSISQPENHEDKPHVTTSKLYVTYNGANQDAVFGKYVCVAKNQVGISNITLDLMMAVAPGEPKVSVHLADARHIEFHVIADKVDGPQVSHFKVTYTKEGGDQPPKELMVENEYRDYIDTDRRHTLLAVNDLAASTRYAFTFFAKNEVGWGPGRQLTYSTPAINVPGIPEIKSNYNSDYPDKIIVIWEKPSDGGAQIEKYSIKYQQVGVKKYNGSNNPNPSQGYELETKKTEEKEIDGILQSPYRITGLIPGAYYQVSVYAHNVKGKSVGGQRIIRTKEAESAPGASTGRNEGLSTGAIIGIAIGVFFVLFIIVDLTCYFKNKCGVLMSIREKVGGGREEGYAVAKTEDVENLAKKDELTEEVKAAEEGELAETIDDDKKAPLLSEEQKVDTIDEGETKPEKPEGELEPEDKEPAKPAENNTEPPKQEEAPAEPEKTEAPATEETAPTEKPQE
ncbi:Neural cell adhesion molecule 1 [Mactra antiquata]